ncbi:DUF2252 domain-containing protein [Frankia sp. Cppng1_Ct_nod]|uniref:DUF2252 domain-containing protein n=1 Tax=Frankia sp. Cppng1_Ct_nod TaxID=2897162 RepID=UPI0010419D74|nr:DUF2252 domain-containing protein [Frankia sp. Cppng1_Ct_nod]
MSVTAAPASSVNGQVPQRPGGRFGTPQERVARGKAARATVPRSSHGEFEPAPKRPDPVDVVERQSSTRVPELVPIRYGRMIESPFRFYRGAAAIMAGDLATTPRTGITAQLCGDAHLLNFRLLASPERHLMFDINDFDETLPGPWEWDVKRLAASFVIAGRHNGFSGAERRTVVMAMVRFYREWMHRFADMGNLAVWYAQVNVEQLEAQYLDQMSKARRRRVTRTVSRARSRDSLRAFEKLTTFVDGERRIVADPPLLVPIRDLFTGVEGDALAERLAVIIEEYRESLSSERRVLLGQYRLVDVARKVVGVGSVGTRCWIVLMLGRDDHDPLLLQVKEADTSVLADHLPASEYANQGQRVVSGQRLMQAASDIFLGWHQGMGIDGRVRDFYVRQLYDWKGIIPVDEMAPQNMRSFAGLCGMTLARAHARSGDRIALASYLGRSDVFDRALTHFAEAYADQNERDHAALVAAVKSGRVIAESA